ncbi:hypothetical protein PP175_05165 [Aneurinibacillus sp. Ricciae_BoGa-3]|uniref:hypothetical protein n=1 Tax=Aneurinibacillus sp. Ricciae_BoGa-3 TaxID=3022697 RepID=UPI0023410886|nr:hypothetical protein [Aneurinibacillus sp. Ricciae_BoGa-3]WCK55361.1 hypothetical protein PP175_05165 [Aneurinibacillus sp. Ricciae_BoGa-3]
MSRRYEQEERYSKLGKEIAQGIREGLELVYNKKIEDFETEVRQLNNRFARLVCLLERQTNYTNVRDGFGLFPNDYL